MRRCNVAAGFLQRMLDATLDASIIKVCDSREYKGHVEAATIEDTISAIEMAYHTAILPRGHMQL